MREKFKKFKRGIHDTEEGVTKTLKPIIQPLNKLVKTASRKKNNQIFMRGLTSEQDISNPRDNENLDSYEDGDDDDDDVYDNEVEDWQWETAVGENECVYLNNPNELVDCLKLLDAEVAAGNNSHHNVSIVFWKNYARGVIFNIICFNKKILIHSHNEC